MCFVSHHIRVSLRKHILIAWMRDTFLSSQKPSFPFRCILILCILRTLSSGYTNFAAFKLKINHYWSKGKGQLERLKLNTHSRLSTLADYGKSITEYCSRYAIAPVSLVMTLMLITTLYSLQIITPQLLAISHLLWTDSAAYILHSSRLFCGPVLAVALRILYVFGFSIVTILLSHSIISG